MIDWDVVGAVGEIIGALAVVLTVGYLAVQIRQSNRVARADAYSRLIDSHVDHHRVLSANPAVMQAWGAGMSNYEALNQLDQMRFHTTIGPIILQFQKYLHLYRLGLVPRAEFEMFELDVIASLLTPGGQQWWAASKGKWSAVSDYLDKRMAELDGHVTPSDEDFGGIFSAQRGDT